MTRRCLRWMLAMTLLGVVLWTGVDGVLQYRDMFGTFRLESCSNGGGGECPDSIFIPRPVTFDDLNGVVVGDIDMTDVTGLECTVNVTSLQFIFEAGLSITLEDGAGDCDTVTSFNFTQYQNMSSLSIEMLATGIRTSDDSTFDGVYTRSPDCFASSSIVRVLRGDKIEEVYVRDVVAGDLIESFDSWRRTHFSRVFLVQHANDHTRRELFDVHYLGPDGSEGILRLTSGHLVFTASLETKRGSAIVQGDRLLIRNDDGTLSECKVVQISRSWDAVRNIHTMNDRLIVDNVAVSSMTDLRVFGIGLPGAILLFPLKIAYLAGLKSLPSRVDLFVHNYFSSLVRV